MQNNYQRIFFALSLNSEKHQELEKNLINSKIQLPPRIIDSSSWHITVYFIGEVSDSKIKELILAAYNRPWPKKFKIVLDHLGAFPDAKNAKLLWYGVSDGKAELYNLVTEISALLYKINLKPADLTEESKPFIPHLTLSRLQKTHDLTSIVNVKFPPVIASINHFSLFRSQIELGPQKYEELASFDLETKFD